ncbi:hypothetical protein FIBSPDRAFT_795302 [Athelia psychrophila]|uniref:Oxidase ustYa n=1 Tax=Athelia psychrophila TaxID=1759441 RepID=A0A165WHV5_9AGAM|nr:hypothetical protein FIBSPDRAFT_939406 [Fibularhizoctonia sp. CBS 109695]KZP15504.1 hypothetical protein FIBSPDRAFT_795302 [Fibularhizoctonia sp. CBS 109695]
MESKPSLESLHLQTHPRRARWRLRATVGVCVVLLLLNLIATIYQIRVQALPPSKKTYTYLNGDWPQELDMGAPLRKVNMAFNDSEPYMDIYDPDAGPVWDANLPAGRGYIKLGQHPELFGVTMFHQMHCLVRLRAVFAGDKDESGHVKHCFNYLRQAILCNADTTLEPGKTVHEHGHEAVMGGYDTLHQCRDWTQVWDYMTDEWHKSFPDPNNQPLQFAAINGQA